MTSNDNACTVTAAWPLGCALKQLRENISRKPPELARQSPGCACPAEDSKYSYKETFSLGDMPESHYRVRLAQLREIRAPWVLGKLRGISPSICPEILKSVRLSEFPDPKGADFSPNKTGTLVGGFVLVVGGLCSWC